MINLLPEGEKTALRKNYRTRVSVVALSLCATLLFIANAILFSFYLLLGSDVRGLELVLMGREKDTNIEINKNIIAEIKKRTGLLMLKDDGLLAQKFLDTILLYVGKGIHLYDIEITNPTNPTIAISGRADTRDAFILFSDALEADTLFSEVSSPLSNLSKTRDIDFKITIIPAK